MVQGRSSPVSRLMSGRSAGFAPLMRTPSAGARVRTRGVRRLARRSCMSARPRGDGGLSWDERRKRWIASTTIGYDGRGKRIVRRAAGRTRTEAKNKLRELLRDREDGFAIANDGYTVAQAVNDWLAFGLINRDPATSRRTSGCARSTSCLGWALANSRISGRRRSRPGWASLRRRLVRAPSKMSEPASIVPSSGQWREIESSGTSSS